MLYSSTHILNVIPYKNLNLFPHSLMKFPLLSSPHLALGRSLLHLAPTLLYLVSPLGFGLLVAEFLVPSAAMAQSTPNLLDPSQAPSPFPTADGESNGDRSTQLRLLPNGSAPSLRDEGYLLGSGDVLQVSIFDVPEYSGSYSVGVDGSIIMPLVGALNVSGLTLPQASEIISRAWAPILQRPIVTLNLAQARPTRVAITGAVTRPGVYTLENLTSLTTALKLAGGVTPSANLEDIQVRRAASRVAGQGQVATLNLQALLQSGDIQQDITLRDGDTIYIPATSQVNLAASQTLANATFGTDEAQPLRIAVVGEVNRPGPYTLISSGSIPRVSNAIQEAGGITSQADVRDITVRRSTQDGESTTIALNFWELLQEGDLNQDMPLQDGDTIVIPTAQALPSQEIISLANSSFSPSNITVNVVGEVVNPGAVQVSPNTPLNQALLASGGLNNRASRESVQLVRLNPDGTVTQQAIEVDLAQGLSSDNNPPLRNNDTVIVGRKGVVQVGDAIGTALGSVLPPLLGLSSFVRLLGF